ncbi:hypothetical protein ACGFNU_40815 [Spirillospora sp. NPDC048911]|uniref:hypothetical protein n=1 Tax=Spirillospora sp. NPDC048911 TaxID=3364527 RepID=UPI003717681A
MKPVNGCAESAESRRSAATRTGAPLDVDIDAKQVLSLPPPWRHALAAPALAAAVGSSPRTLATSRGTARPARRRFLGVTNEERVHQRGTTVLLAADDVLRGEQAHAAALARALQSARTSVALAIARLDGSDVFEALAAGCANAVTRGVRVDLLVGSADGDPAALTAIANRIGYGADARRGRALLRTRVTGGGASLLLWDSAPGRLVGVVTGHAWVGGTAGSPHAAGVRLLSPALCADLARAVASLWTGRSGDDFAGEPIRWRHLADAAVGLYFLDPAGGDAGRRGVQLIVRGPDAQLVRAAPDASD